MNQYVTYTGYSMCNVFKCHCFRGPASIKKDEELFAIDVAPNKEVQQERNLPLTKKERARLPMTCYKNLEPLTKVPDPITKR